MIRICYYRSSIELIKILSANMIPIELLQVNSVVLIRDSKINRIYFNCYKNIAVTSLVNFRSLTKYELLKFKRQIEMLD